MLWEMMRGNDITRFCESCGHHVHNLSALNDHQRAELIARARTEKICGTYQLRLNGELVTPEKPLTPREHLNLKQVGLAALSAGALALAAGCVSKPIPPAPQVMATPATTVGTDEVIELVGFMVDTSYRPDSQSVRNYQRR